MNERIQKLAQQAGFQSYITTHAEDVAMFEKFAELVVKEVTNIVLHYTDVDEGVAVARKHFGVGE